jgi:hypothetical protein
LGSLEVSEGNHQRGMALLELGLSNCPKDAYPERYELLLHLAIAKAETDPAQAAELYQTALQLPLPPRLTLAAQLNLAALLVEAGNSGAAAQLCEQAERCVVNGLQLRFGQRAIAAAVLAGRARVHFGGGRRASQQSRRAGVGATALACFLGCHAYPRLRSSGDDDDTPAHGVRGIVRKRNRTI